MVLRIYLTLCHLENETKPFEFSKNKHKAYVIQVLKNSDKN